MVFPHSRPLRRILLSTMGHCGGFGYTLWATAADLVIHYGPLRRIWLYIMVHCRGFGCAQWATAADFALHSGPLWRIWFALWATLAVLVIRYGPLRQIWLYAMGHFGRFGCALWAAARNEAAQ
jgi:hypothetical protein